MISKDTRNPLTGPMAIAVVLLLGWLALPSSPALATAEDRGNTATHELDAAPKGTAEHLVRLTDFLRRLERKLTDPEAHDMAHAELGPLAEHLRGMADHTFHGPEASADARRVEDHRRSLLARVEYLLNHSAPPLVDGADPDSRSAESRYQESEEMRAFYTRLQERSRAQTPTTGSSAAEDRATTKGEVTSSISGHVVDPEGNPVSSARMVLRTVSGSFYHSDYSDTSGYFEFTNISSGFYYLVTDFYSSYGWLNMAYPDVICHGPPGTCDLSAASTLEITSGSVLEDLDMTLHRGSTVRGRVFWDEDGTAAAYISIYAYSELGDQLRSDRTDIAGRFEIGGLVGGDLRFEARSAEIRDEMWQDRPCSGPCQALDGDAFPVVLDDVHDGLDFSVARMGAIEGEITDALTGDLVSGADVDVYDSDGSFVAGSYSGSSFRVAGLETGTYYAIARSYSYLDQIWQGESCDSGCVVTTGTPISVIEGETVTDIDFALVSYGEISGRVIAVDNGEAVDADLRLYDDAGNWVDNEYTYGSASTYTFDRLPPGQYRVVIRGASGFRAEAFDDHPCPESGCDGTMGDLVTVSSGVETRDIDFALDRLGRISGSVTDSTLVGPAYGVKVAAYDETGAEIVYSVTADDGTYTLDRLPVGNYYVATESDLLADEVWQDRACEGPSCDPTTGTAIVIALGDTVTEIDFELTRRPWIEGHLVEEGTGQGVGGGRVSLYDASGNFINSHYIYENGIYRFTDLAEGTYYLHARGSYPHIPIVWPDISCYGGFGDGCEVTDGDPVVVGAGGVTVDIVLPIGGSISGKVSSDGVPLLGAVDVYDSAGVYRNSDYAAGPDGEFQVVGLEAGTYFVRTDIGYEHVDLLWDGLLCESQLEPDCDPVLGTPIVVERGADAPNIDFDLPRRGSISGTVTDAQSGAGVGSGRVSLYRPDGSLHRSGFITSDGRFELDRLLPGTYYLATTETPGYQDLVYGGTACEPGPCDPVAGTPIAVGLGAEVTGIEVQLRAGPGVSIRLIDAASGAPLVGAAIDLWYESGSHRMTLATDADGRASATLFAGTYYLSTDNGQGLVDELWSDVACPEGSAWDGLCNPQDGTALPMVEGEDMTEMTIALDPPDAFFIDGFESGSVVRWSAEEGLVP